VEALTSLSGFRHPIDIRNHTMRSILLWLIGVPIPIIILIALLSR
jgi:hypothetical protein